jgi:site-specific DNA recombinase
MRPLASGRMIGGVALTHGPLSVILKNRMYLGELKHKGMTYKAEHEPIVTPEVFEAVQQALAANRKGDQDKWSASGALLLGRIYDDRGHRMTPAHANKGPIRYRYYVSRARTQGRTGEPGTIERVPAPAIEAAILTALQAHEQAAARAVRGGEYRLDLTNAPAAPYTEHVISQPASTVDDAAALIDRLLERVTVGERTIVIALQPEKEGAEPTTLTLPWKRPRHARQRAVRGPAGDSPARPTIRAEARARLVAAIARARGWVEDLVEGRVTSTEQIATREGVSGRSVCMALPLALLPPAVVQSAVAGSLPAGLGITTLANLSPNWKAEDFARDQSTSA